MEVDPSSDASTSLAFAVFTREVQEPRMAVGRGGERRNHERHGKPRNHEWTRMDTNGHEWTRIIGEGTIVIMCIAYELIFLFCLGSVSIYNFAKIFKAG